MKLLKYCFFFYFIFLFDYYPHITCYEVGTLYKYTYESNINVFTPNNVSEVWDMHSYDFNVIFEPIEYKNRISKSILIIKLTVSFHFILA